MEAIPRKPITVDILGIRNSPLRNHELLLWTPHFVVLRNSGGQEITLRRDGRMIVRNAASEQTARDAANEVMSLVLKDLRR